MEVMLRYEESKAFITDRTLVYANEACVGSLKVIGSSLDTLNWLPENETNVKFQFRNKETFFAVVRELKRYKDEHGFKYLAIWAYNNGFVSQMDKEVLEEAGFRYLEDGHPACMCLE